MRPTELITPAAVQAGRLMDRLGNDGTAFFFLFDYELLKPVVVPLKETAGEGIFFDFGGRRNFSPASGPAPGNFRFKPGFPSFEEYSQAFQIVQKAEARGDSYLANLTFPTRLDTDLKLTDFFHFGNARFKLLVRDEFTVFSPETFVEIRERSIRTFPMKGTRRIGPDETRDREALLADVKENAEHITVVDLLRNDLSLVGQKTRVEEFKTLTRVTAADGDLLQMHSVVAADLGQEWRSHVGETIVSLLPAGSVTGAPKRRTCEIIREAEAGPRGYYTGVAGLFDGESLISSVLIRFVEKTLDGLVYRSGGGITIYSDARSEYNELREKVYAPFG